MSQYNKRKLEGQTLPLYNKRAYLGDVNPGREYVEPKLYQQPNYVYDSSGRKGTDFSTWTEQELKAFLDERGGEFDDCNSFQDLVERAIETEVNTGPARKPQQTTSAASEPHSAGADAAATGATAAANDEEYDPLEAFMAEINEEVAANKPNKPAGQAEAAECDEAADPATEYMAVRAARAVNSAAAIAANVAAEGYDSDEEVYATARALQAQADAEGGAGADSDDDLKAAAAKARTIDPLAPTDHTAIEYDDFAKDFYTEHPSIAAMTEQQVRDYRRELEIYVSGFDPPKPIQTFGQAGFDHLLLGAIKKAGYEKPTAIQAQALPAVLSGRDVLGLAKTGSGKTAAFVLPMLVHIMDQPELAKGAGPIGLILAPTRELSEQIHKETRKFSKPYGLHCVAAFGGLSKFEQFKELKAGAEIAVATPGRMMDLIRMKACTMQRVTYLVLDEADRMFDMGFEQQVHSLLDAVRPDRQTLLFSATLPRRIEALVAKALNDPVRISVGQLGAANRDVSQRVEVLNSDQAKLDWLLARLPTFIDEGDVLLFAGQRAKVDEVASALSAAGFKAGAIHGDMDQFTRMAVLDAFRSGQHHLLVATDVAARGLDIKSIKTVINFDAARDIDTHIHRVGRTGRAGDKEGVAVTLLVDGSNRDAHFAGLLVSSLTLGGQEVPRDLYSLAMKDARFRKGSNRGKGGKWGKGGRRKGPQLGGAGLGFGTKPQQQQQQQGSSDFGGSGFTATRASQEFVQLPGFAKSHDDYEHESSAAAATATVQQQPVQPPPWATRAAAGGFSSAGVGGSSSMPINFPPPPPLPPGDNAAAAAAAAAVPPLPQGLPPPTAMADDDAYDPTETAAAAAAAAPPLPPGPPPPAAADVSSSSTMADARKELVHTAYASRMKSQFVSSGHRGGDIGQSATIVAPKISISNPAAAAAAAGPGSSSSRPVFKPPVPVTQRPMYLTRPNETITRGRGQPPRQQQQTAPMAGAAAAAAIAQAQAVAARLAAQAGGVQPGAVAVGGVAQPQSVYQGIPQQQQPAVAQQQQQPYAGYHPQVQQQEQPYQSYQQQQQQQVGGGPGGGVAAAVAAAQAIAARLAAQHQGSGH